MYPRNQKMTNQDTNPPNQKTTNQNNPRNKLIRQMNNKSLNQEGINYMNRSMILNDLIEDMDESEEHKVGNKTNPPRQINLHNNQQINPPDKQQINSLNN